MQSQGSTQLTDSCKKTTIQGNHMLGNDNSNSCKEIIIQGSQAVKVIPNQSTDFCFRQERDKDMRVEEKRLVKVKEEVTTEDAKLKKVFSMIFLFKHLLNFLSLGSGFPRIP